MRGLCISDATFCDIVALIIERLSFIQGTCPLKEVPRNYHTNSATYIHMCKYLSVVSAWSLYQCLKISLRQISQTKIDFDQNIMYIICPDS